MPRRLHRPVPAWLARATPLLGDVLACATLLGVLLATAGLPSVELSLAVVPVAAAFLLAFLAFGRASAILAALVLGIALRVDDSLEAHIGLRPGEMFGAAAIGIGAALVWQRLRGERRRVAAAHEWADRTARDAARVAEPRPAQRPAQRPAPLAASPSDAFAQAFRSEGGV